MGMALWKVGARKLKELSRDFRCFPTMGEISSSLPKLLQFGKHLRLSTELSEVLFLNNKDNVPKLGFGPKIKGKIK